MNRKIRIFVFASLFLFFLLMMDYPYLSRIYNDRISADVIYSLSKDEEDSDCMERLEKAAAFNRSLSEAANPGEGISGWKKAARVLCLDGSGRAGWIRIPSLELILPLFVGTDDKALSEGAGILEGSSLPAGGRDTHTCISAHRGLPDRTLFTNLDMLHTHDRVEIHTLGRTICYEVYDMETVLPDCTKSLEIQNGKDLLTLITCTPYGINSHRLYVHARRVKDCEKTDGPDPFAMSILDRLKNPVFWKLWWWVPATAVLLTLMIFLVCRGLRAS